MKFKAIIGVLALSLSLSACQNMGQKEGMGTVAGGAAGALLGNQIGGGDGRIFATVVGGLLGAALGSEVGRGLDELDKIKAQQAFSQASRAKIGDTIAWNNPNSGHSGTVKAVRDGTSSSGRYCREFQTTVTIGGKPQKSYGTACRMPDGQWQMM